jgi:hypothetical protein
LKANSASWLVVTALLIGIGGPAVAEEGYYRWVDKSGNQQHSDRPPAAGINYDFIVTGSGVNRTREESAPAAAGNAAPGETTSPAKPMGVTAQQAEKNVEYCKQARSNLATLSTNARVRLKGADGEFRYLSAEEKETQRTQAAEMIQLHCGE